MKKFIAIAVLACTAATPAMAWGDREQGALAGVAGVLLLQHMNRNNQPVQVQQAPVYNPQYHQHRHNHYGYGYPAPITERPISCRSVPILWDPYTGRPQQFQTICR